MSWHSTPLAGVEDVGQLRRQVGERDRRRQQRIERRIVQQVERRGRAGGDASSAAGATARPARPGSRPASAARMWNAPPSGTATSSAPYQDSSSTVASSPASRSAVASPAARRAGVDHEVAVARRRVRRRKARRRALRAMLGARRHRCRPPSPAAPGSCAHSHATSSAEHARADHRDAVGRARRAVPDGVERRLHVGGEHGALRPAARRAAARYFRPARLNTVWCG